MISCATASRCGPTNASGIRPVPRRHTGQASTGANMGIVAAALCTDGSHWLHTAVAPAGPCVRRHGAHRRYTTSGPRVPAAVGVLQCDKVVAQVHGAELQDRQVDLVAAYQGAWWRAPPVQQPLPQAEEFCLLGVNIWLQARRSTGPLLIGQMDKGCGMLRWVAYLPTFAMWEQAAGTLAGPASLHRVDLATLATEVVLGPLDPGHWVAPTWHMWYLCLSWLHAPPGSQGRCRCLCTRY